MAVLAVGAAAYAGATAAGGVFAAYAATIATVAMTAFSQYQQSKQVIKTQGARLENLSVTGAGYGNPLQRIYGTRRVSGSYIWLPKLIEVEHTESSGGKGGPKSEYTHYTYLANCAIAVCDARYTNVAGISRIWANGKLVFDKRNTSSNESLLQSELLAVRFYNGENNSPDPLIERYHGVGNVPAFKGTAYIVFENLDLSPFGNQLPNFTFEVVEGEKVQGWKETAWESAADMFPSSGKPRTETGNCWFDGGFINYSLPSLSAGAYNVHLSSKKYTITGKYVSTDSFPPSTDVSSLAVNARFVGRSGGAEFHQDSNRVIGSVKSVLSSDYKVQLFSGKVVDAYTFLPMLVIDKNGMLWVSWIGNFTSGGNSSTARAYGYEVYKVRSATPFEISLEKVADYTGYDKPVLGTSGYLSTTSSSFTPDNLYVWCMRQTIGSDTFSGVRIYRVGYNYSLTLAEEIDNINPSGQYNIPCALSRTSCSLIRTFPSYSQGVIITGVGITPTAANLDEVVASELEISGITSSEYDVTALAGVSVLGYATGGYTSCRESLEPLQSTYLFDLVETDGKIVAVKRGGTSVKTIPESDIVMEG